MLSTKFPLMIISLSGHQHLDAMPLLLRPYFHISFQTFREMFGNNFFARRIFDRINVPSRPASHNFQSNTEWKWCYHEFLSQDARRLYRSFYPALYLQINFINPFPLTHQNMPSMLFTSFVLARIHAHPIFSARRFLLHRLACSRGKFRTNVTFTLYRV